ncbi:unnamed protein product [Moneuplotes crassus]|uniref:Uncharacterized protein n=1 Tax=Euplotes crassus TaxID=5936 RepID=A0AAD1U5Q1_EUPCR|nr:unnamed protein product [Moneuplotes crassus]
MERIGQLDRDTKYPIDKRRGSKPVKPYNYLATTQFENISSNFDRSKKRSSAYENYRNIGESSNFQKSYTKTLIGQKSDAFSKECQHLSVSSGAKTNYSSRLGIQTDSRSNYLDSSIQDYTQGAQNPSLRKKNSCQIYLKPGLNPLQGYQKVSNDSQLEDTFNLEESLAGRESSSTQNKNLSFLSNCDRMGRSQQEIAKQIRALKSYTSLEDHPQSCQNKQTSNFLAFKEAAQSRRRIRQHSPSEIGPDEANEGVDILVKNRQKMNSSVVRSHKNKNLSMTSYQDNASFISTKNYVCEAITQQDKHCQSLNSQFGRVDSTVRSPPERNPRINRNNTNSTLIRCASQRKWEISGQQSMKPYTRDMNQRVMSVCYPSKTRLDQVFREIQDGPTNVGNKFDALLAEKTYTKYPKSRSNCPQTRGRRANRPKILRCKSQLGSINGRDRSNNNRQESISRRANFRKLKSKEIVDDVESESSFSSTGSQVSPDSASQDEISHASPASLKATPKEETQSQYSLMEEGALRESSPDPLEYISRASFKSASSSDTDLESTQDIYDTVKFRKNGYLLKKLAILQKNFP